MFYRRHACFTTDTEWNGKVRRFGRPVLHRVGERIGCGSWIAIQDYRPECGIVSGDSGVTYSNTGTPLAKVGSNPTKGQYAVSAGVYTFSAGDSGAQVTISYTYGPHNETVYADQTTSSYPGDRIHSSVSGLPAGGLALATASVDGTGNILSITDARVFNPTLTLQGLKLPSLEAGSGLNNACFDMNGNLTSQASACNGNSVSSANVGLSLPADLSASSPTIPTSGTLTITRNSQSAHTFLAGPASGAAAPPIYRLLVTTDLPTGYPYSNLSGVPTIPSTAAQVGALADPGSGTTILKRVSANTVAAATAADVVGLLGYTPLNPASAQNQNSVYAGPASGGSGPPSFRRWSRLTSRTTPLTQRGTRQPRRPWRQRRRPARPAAMRWAFPLMAMQPVACQSAQGRSRIRRGR